MDYVKIINMLIDNGNSLLQTRYTGNSPISELYGGYDPTEWVNGTEFIAWKTRVSTFLEAHFDEAITEKYTNPFRARGFSGKGTPQTVENVMALLQTLIIQIENREITPKKGSASLGVEGLLITILNKFHRVARQLRTRHDNRNTLEINDEYDVQDLLHAVLLIHFDDVRDEEWTPSYAGGSVRMDFLLKDEKIVIEVKKTRSSMTAKMLGEELVIDIEKYSEHPDCEKLFCFVYDPEGRLGNPTAIMNDLNNRHKGFVQVIIRPEM